MTSRWTVPALAGELVLVAATAALLAGRAGTSPAAAVAAGVCLMAALELPSVLLLVWARERSNVAFLSSVAGTFLGKVAVLGVAVGWMAWRGQLPQLPFVAGLLGAWVLGIGMLGLLLRRPLSPAA